MTPMNEAQRGSKPGRTVVALSGGVDSAVAAALLVEQGHEVIGVTLRLHACDEDTSGRSCCGLDAVAEARAVAGRLGIPHYVLDLEERFERDVLVPAWADYRQGLTPNPCVRCNQLIKFGALLEWADGVGASAVATGHNARLARRGADEIHLLRAHDRAKDQSYFLARIDPAALPRLCFPLSDLDKPEVRARAAALDLPNAARAESQDACLTRPGESFAEMLRRRFDAPPCPGQVLDERGIPLGPHEGVHRFTIGQRRALGVQTRGKAWVRAIDAARGLVHVTHDARDLERARVTARALSWLGAPPADCAAVEIQTRYRQPPCPARLRHLGGDRVAVHAERPLSATAPGQALVLYDGERVLGAGWIEPQARWNERAKEPHA